MVGDGEVGNDRLAEALDLDVAAIVRSDGNGWVNDVRDGEHDGAYALAHFAGCLFKLGKTLGVCLDLCLCFFRFLKLAWVLLCLSHKNAHLLGQRVSRSTQVVCLGEGCAVFHIKLQNLVNEGQLCILELLLYVILDCLGIFSYKLYIKHCDYSLLYF